MIEILSLICLSGALLTLLILSWIDLKAYLLPNAWVGLLAALGVAFHCINGFELITVHQMAYGGLCGFWTLYIIRAIGNWHYKQDSLGLGDVKLLAAGGLWLGIEGVFFAITVGAFAGLIHGIIYAAALAIKTKQPMNVRMLRIPAGPGFAVGLIMVGAYQYRDLIVQALGISA